MCLKCHPFDLTQHNGIRRAGEFALQLSRNGEAALLVPHQSTDALVAEMSDIVSQLRNGRIPIAPLQQKGFANAARFSWDNTYQQTIHFYHSIARE